MEKKRVIIVDDHKLFLDGVRAILSSIPELTVIANANSGNEALELIRSQKPDLVVMDITMPDMNGIDITKIVKSEFSDIKILILTMHLHKRMIVEALKAGADGYILKDSPSEEFISAINTVSGGLKYLSPPVTTLIINEYIRRIDLPTQDAEHLKDISPREREVLALISEGLGTKAICEKLSISRNTVDTHRRNLMQKLGCDNLVDLMRYAIREGAVDLDK